MYAHMLLQSIQPMRAHKQTCMPACSTFFLLINFMCLKTAAKLYQLSNFSIAIFLSKIFFLDNKV